MFALPLPSLPPLLPLNPPYKGDNRAAGLRSISAPPPQHPHEDYGQILATSLKVEDGLRLGTCEYGSWIWTAKVVMYEFSVQW